MKFNLSQQLIGKTYRKIRINQNKTIDQVKNTLSVGAVSRFENGKSDISLNNFLMLLSEINMDIDEFFRICYKSYELKDTNFIFPNLSFSRYLLEISNSRDIKKANELINFYQQKYKKNLNIEDILRSIEVKVVKINILNVKQNLSKKDSQLVENYLVKKAQWHIFDWHLCINTISHLEISSIENIYEKIINIQYSWKNKNVNTTLFIQALFNLGVYFIETTNYKHAYNLLNIINTIPIPQDSFFLKTNIQILTDITNFKLYQNFESLKELQNTLKFIKQISSEFYYKEKAWIKSLDIKLEQ